MSNNLPGDDNFAAALPPQEDGTQNKINPEHYELAQLGASPNWKILTDYLEKRIDMYKKNLFGEDLTGKDSAVIGQRFLAAQSVIYEIESIIAEVNRTTETVKDAIAKKG